MKLTVADAQSGFCSMRYVVATLRALFDPVDFAEPTEAPNVRDRLKTKDFGNNKLYNFKLPNNKAYTSFRTSR